MIALEDEASRRPPDGAEMESAPGEETVGAPEVAGRMTVCRQALVGPPLFFIHIMKTAGTSFRVMLEDALGPEAVYPSTVDLAALPHGWYPPAADVVRNLASIHPHRVLVGHYSAAMLDVLPRGYRGITFLRDPLRRSLSKLRFASVVHGISPRSLMEDEQFIVGSIQDYQSRVLATRELDANAWQGAVDDAMLGDAIGRLDRLAFVGITERFQESCGLFDSCFGTSLATMMRHDNVGGCDSDDLQPFVPLLLPLIARDRILYDHGVGLLESRLRTAGSRAG